MRIGVDVTVLARATRSGVERYAEEILRHLIEVAPQHRFVLSYFAGPRDPASTLSGVGGDLDFRPIRSLSVERYRSLHLRSLAPPFDLLSRGRADVYLFPDFVRWPVLTRRSVVVVHDLAFAKVPRFVPAGTRALLDNVVPRSVAKADAIVAVSEFTKRELLTTFDVDPHRVAVVPNAVDHDRFSPRSSAEIELVSAKLGIDRPYVLMTGTVEPRKNVAGLLRAFASMPDVRRTHALVLAGSAGWLDDEIRALAGSMRRSGMAVIQPGHVEDADLPALYSGAAVFVLPSWYEGFGVPVLEAMACGAPVVTTRNASLPEAAGEAALFAEGGDPPAIAAAVERVLRDPVLRADLCDRGLVRARGASWTESARRMLACIDRVVGDRGRTSPGDRAPR